MNSEIKHYAAGQLYEGCSLRSVIGLIILTLSALWQRALYQLKA